MIILHFNLFIVKRKIDVLFHAPFLLLPMNFVITWNPVDFQESPSSCFFQYQPHVSRPCRSLDRFATCRAPLCSLKPRSLLCSLSFSTLKLITSTCSNLEKLTSVCSISEDEQHITSDINEWAHCNACDHETCLTKLHGKMFYTVWSRVWRRSNFIKYDRTRLNKVSKRENVLSQNNVWACLIAKHFSFKQCFSDLLCHFDLPDFLLKHLYQNMTDIKRIHISYNKLACENSRPSSLPARVAFRVLHAKRHSGRERRRTAVFAG